MKKNNNRRSREARHYLYNSEEKQLFSQFDDLSPYDELSSQQEEEFKQRVNAPVEKDSQPVPVRRSAPRRRPVREQRSTPQNVAERGAANVRRKVSEKTADRVQDNASVKRTGSAESSTQPSRHTHTKKTKPNRGSANRTANASDEKSARIKRGRKKNRKLEPADVVIRILSGFLVTVFVLALIIFFIWRYAIGEAKTGVTDSTAIVTNEVGETISTSSTQPVKVRDEQIINILLMGMDLVKPGEVNSRSDTMMLVTIDQKRNVVKLTSFQRDMLVYLPGTNTPVKLNSASQAGPFRLIETLNNTFHLDIKDYIKFDIRGAEAIIDAVGGVDVVLPDDEEVLTYLRRLITEQNSTYEGWDDRTNWSPNIWEGGPTHLNGRQAVAYARMRELDSDFKRMERQQEVITKVYAKVKQSSPTALLNLVRISLSFVETNMTDTELTQMGISLLPSLSNEIQRQTVPMDGTYWADSSESWVIRANFNMIIPLLHRYIYEEELGEFTSTRLVPYAPMGYTEEWSIPLAVRQGWYQKIPYAGPNGYPGGEILDSRNVVMNPNLAGYSQSQQLTPSSVYPYQQPGAVSSTQPIMSQPTLVTTPSPTTPAPIHTTPAPVHTTSSAPQTTTTVPTHPTTVYSETLPPTETLPTTQRTAFPVPPRN